MNLLTAVVAALGLLLAAAQALAAQGTSSVAVQTGADVLVANGFDALAGRRVGLVANATSRTGGERLLDVMMRHPSVDVVAVFSPEHGFATDVAAGIRVASGRDHATRIPVHSLYGDARKPTPEMLRGIDVLVFDIQDVGARPYTYVSTMGLAMQAAAEAGIAFHVLDRPNPLGGELMEGFVLEPGAASFVGLFPVPMTHGMTVGELARFILAERLLPGLDHLRLEVTPMQGWRRDMLWPDTGLRWVSPSPNLPTFEAALAYPGLVFLEATVASEGRGTYEPFTLFGAAGVDGAGLAARLDAAALPGVAFRPATFTPRPIPGMAASPKLSGRRVEGVQLIVTDRRAFRPVETGVHVVSALHRALADRRGGLVDRPRFLRLLSGGNRLGRLLAADTPPVRIAEAWAPDVAAFAERRRPWLLYD